MALTEEQKEEAIAQYIEAQLSEEDRAYKKLLDAARIAMDDAELHFAELQSKCPHPLIMRVHKNEGSTGGWDRCNDSYWTSHKCNMCDKRWHTHQRWAQVGGRQGHPDDKEAKET